jgi:hypothetical protein
MADIKKITKKKIVRKRIGNGFMDSKYVESPRVDQFLKDIFKVYEKYDMALAHEDSHGAFLVEKLNDSLVEWMWAAQDKTHSE